MTIYKVSRGNAWDEYDIAYLTEDKLEEYLNAVYNSSWMEQHKHNHLDGINETEKDYRKNLIDIFRVVIFICMLQSMDS